MQVRGAVEPSPGADARDSGRGGVGKIGRGGLRRKMRSRSRRRRGRGRRSRWGAQGTDYLPAWGRAQVRDTVNLKGVCTVGVLFCNAKQTECKMSFFFLVFNLFTCKCTHLHSVQLVRKSQLFICFA